MEEIVKQLMCELERTYKETSTISDDLLAVLHFVFPGCLQPALDLIDHNAVSCLLSPSGRTIYQVIGSSGVPYTCPNSLTYCSCPAFRYTVLRKEETSWCKHLLAVHLCKAMGTCQELKVTDEEMKEAIQMID